jgi:hypothetical protein
MNKMHARELMNKISATTVVLIKNNHHASNITVVVAKRNEA